MNSTQEHCGKNVISAKKEVRNTKAQEWLLTNEVLTAYCLQHWKKKSPNLETASHISLPNTGTGNIACNSLCCLLLIGAPVFADTTERTNQVGKDTQHLFKVSKMKLTQLQQIEFHHRYNI